MTGEEQVDSSICSGNMKRKGDSAISEYKQFSKMGFISLEEIDVEEAKCILKAAKKEISVAVKSKTEKQVPENANAFSVVQHIRNNDGVMMHDHCVNLPAWETFNLPPCILRALSEANYHEPTSIQKNVLEKVKANPNNDILGSAPTGSGKTLAFLLPILMNHHLNQSPSPNSNSLSSLIIVPTRELALQIKKELDLVTRFVDQPAHAVVLVGGLSQEKQERLLGYSPKILIGTPGRLAQVLCSNENLKGQLAQLNYLVLDEADRLVEQGHFKDLDLILELLKPNEMKRKTFLFSATLAMKSKAMEQLRKKLHLNKPLLCAVANSSSVNPATLQHFRLKCLVEQKTLYLYALWRSRPFRALVFVNSIELVRDLVAHLQLLSLPVYPLHAQMQQRQRLKNLDRFKNSINSLLITSDVAARGLDIPNVEVVIHYHVPKTLDTFLHRSGRTARASKVGSSIALVAPNEASLFNQFIDNCQASLKEIDDLHGVAESLRKAIVLAQKIHRIEATEQKKLRTKSWEQRTAEALGVDLEDDFDKVEARKRKKTNFDDDGSVLQTKKQLTLYIASLKAQLSDIISSPISRRI